MEAELLVCLPRFYLDPPSPCCSPWQVFAQCDARFCCAMLCCAKSPAGRQQPLFMFHYSVRLYFFEDPFLLQSRPFLFITCLFGGTLAHIYGVLLHKCDVNKKQIIYMIKIWDIFVVFYFLFLTNRIFFIWLLLPVSVFLKKLHIYFTYSWKMSSNSCPSGTHLSSIHKDTEKQSVHERHSNMKNMEMLISELFFG